MPVFFRFLLDICLLKNMKPTFFSDSEPAKFHVGRELRLQTNPFFEKRPK